VSDVGKSLKEEDLGVNVDRKPTIDLTNDYKEHVDVPLFLNFKKNSSEIILNESHLNPTHRLVRNFNFSTTYMIM